MPTQLPQFASRSSVPFDIGSELSTPEVLSGLGEVGETTIGVAMPEAPLHKNHRAVPGQNDIRTPWKRTAVQPEPEANAVQGRPYSKLGLGVLGADARHDAAALRGRNGIHATTESLQQGAHNPRDLSRQERGDRIPDLNVLRRTRAAKKVVVRKCLNTRGLAHR
jgi:hypothetical protein